MTSKQRLQEFFTTRKNIKKFTSSDVPLFVVPTTIDYKDIYKVPVMINSTLTNDNVSLNLVMGKDLPTIIVSGNRAQQLFAEKNRIDKYKRIFYKFIRLTNPYELVDTDKGRHSVLDIKTINRAYFKLHEIVSNYKHLLPDTPITYVALAEGPGGFIQNIHDLRHGIPDKVHGITLKDQSDTSVGWDLCNDMTIHYGHPDVNDGDLTNPNNIVAFVNNVPNEADFITADGGFGVPATLENHKEICHLQLFFCEILTALAIQKIGGNFVLKLYDMFTLPTLQLLYILSSFYEQIHITKPVTSRPANSEKYIICMNFKGVSDSFLKKMLKCAEIMYKEMNGNNGNKYFIHSFMDNMIPSGISESVIDFHNVVLTRQIRHINRTLGLARKYDLRHHSPDKHTNVKHEFRKIQQKSIKKQRHCAISWAKKYNIPLKEKYSRR